MGTAPLKAALAALREPELARIAHIADRLWAGHPLAYHGQQAYRRRVGQGMEFLDYRDYATGDDPRRIDWRASARSRYPQVRRYHDETSSDWLVCLDHSASMGTPDQGKWHLACQVYAAVTYLLLHRGNRVGTALFGKGIDAWRPVGRGILQFGQVLSLLLDNPLPEAGNANLGACISKLRRRTSVFVISDFLAPDAMRGDLQRLRQLGGELHGIQVLDREECVLPQGMELLLQDAESGARFAYPAQAGTRTAGQRLLELQRELGEFCQQRHIRFSHCHTSQTWQEVVVQHLTDPGPYHA